MVRFHGHQEESNQHNVITEGKERIEIMLILFIFEGHCSYQEWRIGKL